MMPACDPITLAVPEDIWREILDRLDEPVEGAAMLMARPVGALPGPLTLVVRDISWVPEDAYVERAADGLTISSGGWVPPLARAEAAGCMPVFLHTHPQGDPRPSRRDDHVEDQIASVVAARSGQGQFAAVIVGGVSHRPMFTGRIRTGEQVSPMGRLRVAGATTRLLLTNREPSNNTNPTPVDDIFDRQVRAFGDDGQRVLNALQIGVVGAGGTGSAVIQQLLRLGVGHITVIDKDTLEPSNITRVHGSGMSDAGAPKVDIAFRENDRIGLGTTVTAIRGDVTERHVVETLSHCDYVFGCTDDHAGRGVLTRLPTYLLCTLLDIGVVVDSIDSVLVGVIARLTAVTPGSACLFCTRDIDPARAAAEQLPTSELKRQQAEGYAPELDTRDPAVVAYTTLIASIAVSELLDRLLTHVDPEPPNRLLVRVHDRQVSTLRKSGGAKHWCQQTPRAAGGAEPFLGIFDGAQETESA